MADFHRYDVVVIGAGHAGCEAALAAARVGARTLLLTPNLDHVAQMSCNPSIGGIAKGQVVRELDALGGEMGRNTDATTIQFRMLNRSKGPAVWSPRAQCDKLLYQRRMKHVLERQPGLFLHQAEAVRLRPERGRIVGVRTQFQEEFAAAAVVVATGTFLRGRLHYGQLSWPGGRAGDAAAVALAECLQEELGLRLGRLKTGTPPRLLAKSIDFAALEVQESEPGGGFSHWPAAGVGSALVALERRPCYSVRSTAATRQLVLDNLGRSPLYNGTITGTPTRYCPSFEDKVIRFPHHEAHHLYLEPEGGGTDEYYLNGLSTSLPTDVQWALVRSLPGLAAAELARYAYAIEYDFVSPDQLGASLAVRAWPNLFLAGQINGTTGYEEAAGQGLMAGLNAARLAAGRDPVVLGRDQAYIGVMIDDLVTKEIVEPYRLFTSRAEYRLLLRQDNCLRRLAPLGHDLGLLPAADYERFRARERQFAAALAFLRQTKGTGGALWELLRRRDLQLDSLAELAPLAPDLRHELEVEAHYEGYIKMEAARAANLRQLEAWKIPPDFDYDLRGLRPEARQKLERRRPATLAQAARLDGVTPAEIALLQVHLKRRRAPPAAADS